MASRRSNRGMLAVDAAARTIAIASVTAAIIAATAVGGVGAFQTAGPDLGLGRTRGDAVFGSLVRPGPRPPAQSPLARRRSLSVSATASESDTDLRSTDNLRLEQNTWMFRDKYPIAYKVASAGGSSKVDGGADVVPILLLNGFGVGSFHQHRLMRQLLLEHRSEQQTEKRRQYVIYGIDYLGQGKSWPTDCDDGNSSDELDLGYSADTWLDQIKGFIDEVVVPQSAGRKVHLVGNSVGGYLSTILTSRHPDLIESLTLMNATPVWGLNLPGWDGRLPAPPLPKVVGRKMFDVIRDLDVIDQYLQAAYVHKEAYDGTFDDSFYGGEGKGGEGLPPKIRGCTEGKGGHAAFASILWSAPASEKANDVPGSTSGPADFYEALGSLPADVLLLFGDDDPWCTPAVAKRMHITLCDRGELGTEGAPAGRYVAIENAGHCPGHEAPTAVARTLLRWIGAPPSSSKGGDESSDDRSTASLVPEGREDVMEPWGLVTSREVPVEESRDLGVVDRIVSSMVG